MSSHGQLCYMQPMLKIIQTKCFKLFCKLYVLHTLTAHKHGHYFYSSSESLPSQVQENVPSSSLLFSNKRVDLHHKNKTFFSAFHLGPPTEQSYKFNSLWSWSNRGADVQYICEMCTCTIPVLFSVVTRIRNWTQEMTEQKDSWVALKIYYNFNRDLTMPWSRFLPRRRKEIFQNWVR